MNFCNFGKVIMARATRDIAAVTWWNTEKEKELNTNLTNNLSMKDRYDNYKAFMDGYAKMDIEYEQFRTKVPKIQNYLKDKKYWKDHMAYQQKDTFYNYFSLQSFYQQNREERQQHKLEDCRPCNTTHFNTSSLHKSINKDIENAHQMIETGTENIINITSPTSSTATKGIKVMKSIVEMVQPIIQNQMNINFDRSLAEAITIAPPITPQDLKKTKAKITRESKAIIEETIKDNGNDVQKFLGSSLSFREHDRIRLDNFFETREEAAERTTNEQEKIESGTKKQKSHHAAFDSYSFDKASFLDEMSALQPEESVNWTELGRKYNVSINGKFPSNAGQILKEYAKKNGINTAATGHSSEGGRVRRGKKKIKVCQTEITLPTPRSSQHLKKDIKDQISSGKIYLGEKIAHKEVITKTIKDGHLETKTLMTYSRHYPLEILRKTALEDQLKLGVLRHFSDEDYSNMTDDEITARYHRIEQDIPINTTKDEIINNLKGLEQTRKIKMWHDHSSILNHSYVSFTVSWIYDTANYLTDAEYKEKYPTSKRVNVQSLVEKPYLYIFGQSGKYM